MTRTNDPILTEVYHQKEWWKASVEFQTLKAQWESLGWFGRMWKARKYRAWLRSLIQKAQHHELQLKQLGKSVNPRFKGLM